MITRNSTMLETVNLAKYQLDQSGSQASNQMKKHFRELIEAFTSALDTREKSKSQERIQTAVQNDKAQLDALATYISVNTNELNSFADQTDPQNLDSVDIKEVCDNWEHSVRTDVVTSTLSPLRVLFIPGAMMSLENLPEIGRLRISRPVNYTTGKISQTVFGSHGRRRGELGWPSRVAVCPGNGNIVVVDAWNNRVQIFNTKGQFLSMFEKFDFDACTSTGGVAITNQQTIAVCDNHRVQIFTEKGKHLRTFCFPGNHIGCTDLFSGMSCHQDNLYICDQEHCQVLVTNAKGTVTMLIGTDNGIPMDVAVFPSGEIVITYGEQLHVHPADGSHKATLGGGEPGSVELKDPRGVAADSEGHIIVSDIRTHKIHILEQSGQLIRTFGSEGNKPGQFEAPISVACTQDGRIVVVERDNHRIQVFRFD